MTDKTSPLDEARLAAIRKHWQEAHVSLTNATFDKPRPDVAAMNRTVDYAAHVGELLAEVDRLRAREASLQNEVNGLRHGMMLSLEPGLPTLMAENMAAMAIVVELARQDDTRGINCSCRETMPVGHHDDCCVFRAHMLAHQLPDGSYE